MSEFLNLDDLAVKLGDYCRDEDVKREFVSNMAINPEYGEITTLSGVIDEAPLPNVLIGDPWTPVVDTSDISGKFKADVINADADVLKVQKCLIPLKITPSMFHASYLGLLDKENIKGKSAREQAFYIPFEEYLMQQIAAQAKSKLWMNTVFRGVRNNSGTTSAALFDGYLKQIADAITASEITPVGTGPIDMTNNIEKLLMVYDALPEETKGSVVDMYVNPTLFDSVNRLYSPITNPQLLATDAIAAANLPMRKTMSLPGTGAILHREPGMGTSNRVICCTRGLLHFGFNADPKQVEFDIQKENLSLKFIMYIKMGVKIAALNDIHGLITVNDEA
jgi:hypothetical protein